MPGQLIPRDKNLFLLRVFLGRDGANGRRRYINETFHGNKKAAQTRLTNLLRDRDLGTLIEPTHNTLGEFLDHWLESTMKTSVRARTHRGYKELIDRYIRTPLGARRLAKITPLDIQKLYSDMLDRELSPKTVRLTHGVLRSALNQAVKWRLLAINPALAVDLPKQKKKEMHALSPDQASKFLNHAKKDRYSALFSLAITTGMRPGEYLGLQWKDVDLEKGLVVIRRTLVPKGPSVRSHTLHLAPHSSSASSRTSPLDSRTFQWEFVEPKTPKSARTIPLPKSVTAELKTHKRKQAAERLKAADTYSNHDLVFATAKGEPVEQRNLVNRHFKKILESAGLPSSIRLYDLRHSCATLLLAQGEHPKIVSERLGHASVTLTLDTYSHVLPTMQQQAADRLESTLFASRRRKKGA